MTNTHIASKRAALYVRVSTADRGQTVENQLQPLQEAAARLGWTIVAIHRDEGISGAKGRRQRPGLDALLKGVTRREYDVVAAWSVCRLGRSLPDLLIAGRATGARCRSLSAPAGARYRTPTGRMLFGMLGVFGEFERAMIRDRVLAGLHRARHVDGKRLGRPPMSPIRITRIRAAWLRARCARDGKAAEGVGGEGQRDQAVDGGDGSGDGCLILAATAGDKYRRTGTAIHLMPQLIPDEDSHSTAHNRKQIARSLDEISAQVAEALSNAGLDITILLSVPSSGNALSRSSRPTILLTTIGSGRPRSFATSSRNGSASSACGFRQSLASRSV